MTELRLHVDDADSAAQRQPDVYQFPRHLASQPSGRAGVWRPAGPLPSAYRLDGSAVRNDPLIAEVERMLGQAEQQFLRMRELVDQDAHHAAGDDDRPKAA